MSRIEKKGSFCRVLIEVYTPDKDYQGIDAGSELTVVLLFAMCGCLTVPRASETATYFFLVHCIIMLNRANQSMLNFPKRRYFFAFF